MSAIPTWLIGRFVTSIAIIPQTVGSDGTLTAGTSKSLTGRIDEITRTSTNETEPIMPFDNRQETEVITGSGTVITLIEILDQQSTGNILDAVSASADIVSVTFTRGGKVFTGFFVVGSYSEGLRRGKSVGQLDLKPTGIAFTNA